MAKSLAIQCAEHINRRNQFYVIGKKRLNISICIALVLMFLSYALNIFTSSIQGQRFFFAAHSNFEFVKLIKRSEPIYGDDFISNWTEEAIEDIFDFSFVNYKKHLNLKTNKYISTSGRASLIKALQDAGILELLVDSKLILKIDAESGVISSKKVNKETGNFEWVVELPIVTNYIESEFLRYKNVGKAKVTVKRKSLLEGNDGLEIDKILFTIVK
ncbi:DotI/IcmL family type IV secretion protein [Pseudoalteromonas sp. OFAV1]|uniref:DotI/IcmL family type IV secretion protein n=1 Tax=Pseudoalteromonas sp. OFAV1 TaxID=2908892 RepID=UPI001F469C6E|nr:DotI/IcmL family type IV secretion protein [Pseudoalteromonas sp. OFAV1]MCF2901199.1 DotI/IcmL family type IV secretion protein [Pseudoalteromonas sp. OFAV1]